MLLTALRILAIPIGLLAYCIAFLMFEDEEGEWQNRLESLWIAVNDREKLSGGKTSALFSTVADVLTRALNRLLGRKLLSFQVISVSLSSSLAAMLFGFAILCLWMAVALSSRPSFVPYNFAGDAPAFYSQSLRFVVGGLICSLFAGLPAIWRSWFSVLLSAIPGALLTYGVFRAEWFHRLDAHGAGMFVAFIVSFLCDLLLLFVVRFSMRQVSLRPTLGRIAVSLALQAGSIALFLFVPAEVILQELQIAIPEKGQKLMH